MVKAKTKALNILLPEDLAIWLDGYATEKTKTKIICELLEGLRKNGANPVGNSDVDNSVDGIEPIITAYLDKHLQSYIDKHLHDTKQADVVNPVDSAVDDSVDNHIDDSVDNHIDDSVDTDVVTVDVDVEAIENIAAPIVENPDNALSDASAASDLSKGMKINEAFELAKQRGYKGSESKSFRDAYRKNPDYGKQFGLDRIEFKDGKDRWLYFDTQTHT